MIHLWDSEYWALLVAGSPHVYDRIKPYWCKVKYSTCFSFVWWGAGTLVLQKVGWSWEIWYACWVHECWKGRQSTRCFVLAPYLLYAETCEITSPVSQYEWVVSSITNHNGLPFFSHVGFVSFPDQSPGSLDPKPICPQHLQLSDAYSDPSSCYRE